MGINYEGRYKTVRAGGMVRDGIVTMMNEVSPWATMIRKRKLDGNGNETVS